MDRLSDYDYDLPKELIAQRPLEDRSASRLMWLHRESGEVEHLSFRDIPDILRPGDLLVLNDTRVTALRLYGRRPTGGQVEALLIREQADGLFEALVKPAKRLKPGSRVCFDDLEATVEADLGEGMRALRFDHPDEARQRLKDLGKVPLPPYIEGEVEDPERYQTVFARVPGSSAAPTAGLHFTPELLGRLREKGVETAFVTLDVSVDTFRPVTAENLSEHKMHGERCSLPPETAEAIARCEGRIVAVGTTTVRTLETFAIGARKVESGETVSSLLIRPGFQFHVVDGMFTNFHLPRTTMLLMVSALAGTEALMRAYRVAVRSKYRFLSFGDAMLVL